MNALSPDQLDDLRRSGLTEATIAACRFEGIRPKELPMKGAESAYRLPYFNVDGSVNGFHRLKFVPEVVLPNGKKMKYWQPQGSLPHLYLPPIVDWKAARQPGAVLTIVEGEKKAASCCQAGLLAVGVGGVWNGSATLDTGDTLVLPAFDAVMQPGMSVELAPDSDAWRAGKEHDILAGFFTLGKIFQARGFEVRLIRLPDLHGVKSGPDDWLLIPGNDIEHAWPKLERVLLDDDRLDLVNAQWQRRQEKKITLTAIQQQDAEALTVTEVVGLYTVHAATHHVVFTFDRLQEQRGAYHAELTVTLGATVLLDATDVNLKSDAAQMRLAQSLKTSAAAIPWKVLLPKACALVMRRHRRGEPPVQLTKHSEPEPFTYAINPLVLRKKPVILFADGGKGKSTYALMLAMLVSTGQSVAGFSALPGKALYLDWEDDVDVHTRRLHAIRAGHPELDAAEVSYQRCCEPLTKLTYDLARTIQHEGITFLVIDSLLAAMGGDASAEAVGKFFAAVRTFQVESLLIGHTPKTLAEGQEHATVYGSVFNQNYARGTWELKTEQEIGDDSAILGLFHRKSNLTRKHPPIGLKVTHNPDGSCIKYEPFDLTKTAEIVDALPLPNRIRNLFDSDGLLRTSQQVADELHAKLGTVKTTLSNPRHKGFKWSMFGEGKEAKWGSLKG